jgi:hypothetical protein
MPHEKVDQIRIEIRPDQHDYLKSQARRLGVSVSRMMLIFFHDGRLTPKRSFFVEQGVKRLHKKGA